MRGNLGLFLQGLQDTVAQNQLRFWCMAKIRAPSGASALVSVARTAGTSAPFVAAGLVLLTAIVGGLGVSGGNGEQDKTVGAAGLQAFADHVAANPPR